MTKMLEKLEGRTKQFIGDGRLAAEGDQQVRKADVKSQSDDREGVRQ